MISLPVILKAYKPPSVTHADQALRYHLKTQLHIDLPCSLCYDGLKMVEVLKVCEERWSPHRQDVPAPAHSASMQKKRKKIAIHTLGTGMTSTWSHYNTRETQKQKQGGGWENNKRKGSEG